MSKPYEFYLRGTNTFFGDATPYVTTAAADSAPGTMQGPPTSTAGWITVRAYGADATLPTEGDEWMNPAGQAYKDIIQRWQFTLKTLKYGFPADWSDWYALQQHITRTYLYMAVKTYDITLHPVDRAIPVTVDSSPVHEYSDGTKSMTLTLKRRVTGETLG